MKRNVKITLYYIFMFLMMCTLIYLIELKSDYDVSHSYEKSSYAGYEQYVSVPKNLEVLGRKESANFFRTIYETATDELLMVLFLIISTIPLAIYYSAKYIEKLDTETNELIDISNNEYLENRESGKEKIGKTHKALLESGYLNFKSGMFAGMLSDHLKMKDIFISSSKDRANAMIFEQNEDDLKYVSKILKGISYGGESIVMLDVDNKYYEDTAEIMNGYGYNVIRLDLSTKDGTKSFLPENVARIANKLTKKNKDELKINVLDYFESENEVLTLANLITNGNSHATKMLASLIFVTINDSRIENPSLSDVYKLACEGLESASAKVNYVKSAYTVFNELILLDDKTKELILEQVQEDLEAFDLTVFSPRDNRDKKLKLNTLKSNSDIYYINMSEMQVTSAIGNVMLEIAFNVAKKAFINDSKSASKKVYLVNTMFNKYPKYNHISDRLKESKRYGVYYILGITNVKQFKDKYEYDVDRIFDYVDIKLFYSIRQYETTATLKKILSNYTLQDVASIINNLDTNKCIACSKEQDYIVLNIDEPSGEKYDKYQFSDVANEEAINKMKNKDVRLKVNYLDEFENRLNTTSSERDLEREKALNLKPELTKEEKEYIANLLQEKSEDDSKKNETAKDLISDDSDASVLTKSLTKLYDKGEDIEIQADSEKDIDSNSSKNKTRNKIKNLYTEAMKGVKNKNKKVAEVKTVKNILDDDEIFINSYVDTDEEISDDTNSEAAYSYSAVDVPANARNDKTSSDTQDNYNDFDDEINNDKNKIAAEEVKNELKKSKTLRTENDINESIEKLTKMQSKFEELINEEKKKTTHALYEQMKNLK